MKEAERQVGSPPTATIVTTGTYSPARAQWAMFSPPRLWDPLERRSTTTRVWFEFQHLSSEAWVIRNLGNLGTLLSRAELEIGGQAVSVLTGADLGWLSNATPTTPARLETPNATPTTPARLQTPWGFPWCGLYYNEVRVHIERQRIPLTRNGGSDAYARHFALDHNFPAVLGRLVWAYVRNASGEACLVDALARDVPVLADWPSCVVEAIASYTTGAHCWFQSWPVLCEQRRQHEGNMPEDGKVHFVEYHGATATRRDTETHTEVLVDQMLVNRRLRWPANLLAQVVVRDNGGDLVDEIQLWSRHVCQWSLVRTTECTWINHHHHYTHTASLHWFDEVSGMPTYNPSFPAPGGWWAVAPTLAKIRIKWATDAPAQVQLRCSVATWNEFWYLRGVGVRTMPNIMDQLSPTLHMPRGTIVSTTSPEPSNREPQTSACVVA